MNYLRLNTKPATRNSAVIILLLLLISLSNPGQTVAQDVRLRNTIDLSHPWASETNPALLSHQNRQIALGIKAFHYGFLQDNAMGLRESRINASFPFLLPFELAVGGDIRYFSAGIFNELSTSLIFSKQVLNNLSLGINLGILSTGFSRENFKLLEIDDPLLQGELRSTHFTMGLGAFYQIARWSFGAGIEHFNQPDIGLQTEAILRRRYSGAIGYRFQYVTPALTAYDDGNIIHYGVSVAMNAERIGMIRLGYQNEIPFKLEVQVNLSKNNSLQYGMDLPGKDISMVSLGSHELVFSQILGRDPEMGQPELYISTAKMKIYEETFVRSMPANLSIQEINEMGEVLYEFTDSKINLANSIVVKSGALSMDETEELKLDRFTKIGKALQQALTNYPDFQVIIRTDNYTMRDAREMKQFLTEKALLPESQVRLAKFNSSRKSELDGFVPGKVAATKPKKRLSRKNLEILLKVESRKRKTEQWQFSVVNASGFAVKNIFGKEKLPEKIAWDWTDNSGQVISEGCYTCQLDVTLPGGKTYKSVSHPVQVDRLKRTIKLEFNSESKMLISQTDSQ